MASVFTTPVLTPALRGLAEIWLKLSGWHVEAPPEDVKPPFVFLGAPHTSNWDFLLLLVSILHLRMDAKWMGKHTLFRPPFGGLMRWLGGIPVDRTVANNNTVATIVAAFARDPQLIVCIPPEGTRKKVTRWRTGFYHIALGAGVPVLLTVLDAEHKVMRVLGVYRPTGDAEREIREIQQYYRGFRGLRPENCLDIPAMDDPRQRTS